MKDYPEFSDLAEVYLEDSYVLSILEGGTTIAFELEVVLTERHPRYHTPVGDEQYCYAHALLVIDDATDIVWLQRNDVHNVDPDGTVDLGNIYSLRYLHHRYEVTGEWGEVSVNSKTDPRLVFEAIDQESRRIRLSS